MLCGSLEEGLARLRPSVVALVVGFVETDALRAVCEGITEELEFEAGLGTVGSNDGHLLGHVALSAVLEGLKVLAEGLLILSFAEQSISFLLEDGI